MSTTKADATLVQLDRIKATIDEAQRVLGMSPQPIPQFFAPPCPVWLALVNAAYDRSRLRGLLEYVPEPEERTRSAFHSGPRKARASAE